MEKYTILLCALAISAVSCLRAQTVAPAVESPSNAKAKVAGNEDRSYVDDYKDKKTNLVLIDPKTKRETPVSLKEINSDSFVFLDSSNAEIPIPRDKFTFIVGVRDKDLNRGKSAVLRGNYDDAVAYMRPAVYPLLPLTVLSENSFAGSDYVDMYINALINSGRCKELASLLGSMPISDVSPSMLPLVVKGLETIAAGGNIPDAVDMLGKIDLRKPENAAVVPDMLAVLDIARKSGEIKNCSAFYTKLSSVESPAKVEASLWAVYCDLLVGNKMSADILLGNMKVDRKSKVFSLMQMDKGMSKLMDKKPSYSEGLDLFAEGIVFGSVTSTWMPELLYRTGMAYKALGNKVASNEIFSQIAIMYPDDVYAEKGKKEIVKIDKVEKKEKDVVVNEDDEDEDEDEEDEED